jgi:hypothetical protein
MKKLVTKHFQIFREVNPRQLDFVNECLHFYISELIRAELGTRSLFGSLLTDHRSIVSHGSITLNLSVSDFLGSSVAQSLVTQTVDQ